jgi:predicted DNA-binding ribbon-helix-helix protein
MEQVMWTSLTDICRREDRTINEIISAIDEKRAETNLTAAIRVFIICYYRDATLNVETKHGFAEEASFDLAIYQSVAALPSCGNGKHICMSLTMRRRPRVNQEVLLRATFLG